MLSHFQDKLLPSSKTLLNSLRLPKFFNAAQAPSQGGITNDAETEALAPNDELEQIELQEMGFQEQVEASEAREGDPFAQVVAIASVATFLVVTWIVTFTSGTSFYWFGWHPLLMSSAIALMTYGILTLQPTAHPKTKAAGLTRHQLAMIVVGFPVAFMGYTAVFVNKLIGSRAHFTSWHGTFGLITFIFTVTQIILGGGSVWFNGRLFGGNPRAKFIWKYHRAVGYTSFTLSMLTAHLGGAWSHWSTDHSWWIARVLAYTLAPAVLIAAIFSRIRLSKMKFF